MNMSEVLSCTLTQVSCTLLFSWRAAVTALSVLIITHCGCTLLCPEHSYEASLSRLISSRGRRWTGVVSKTWRLVRECTRHYVSSILHVLLVAARVPRARVVMCFAFNGSVWMTCAGNITTSGSVVTDIFQTVTWKQASVISRRSRDDKTEAGALVVISAILEPARSLWIRRCLSSTREVDICDWSILEPHTLLKKRQLFKRGICPVGFFPQQSKRSPKGTRSSKPLKRRQPNRQHWDVVAYTFQCTAHSLSKFYWNFNEVGQGTLSWSSVNVCVPGVMRVKRD